MASRKLMVAAWLFVLVMICAGVGLWQRESLTLWYQTWKLQKATPDVYHTFVLKFEAHGWPGAEALLKLFQADDDMTCLNAGQVLIKLLQIWGTHDKRYQTTFEQMALDCVKFSPAGQRECLSLIQQLINEGQPTEAMTQVIGTMSGKCNASIETRMTLFDTMAQLLRQDQNINETFLKQARACVMSGIKDENVQIRLMSVRLAVTPALQLHASLTTLVSGAVIDASPKVRQLALLALGEHDQLLSTDELCRHLHDENEEVRNIAERALKVRGLNKNQLKLAHMMNDPNPATRAALPSIVFDTPEVDAVQWMERLCKDPIPAVRAASARAMGEQGDHRLQSLLQQLTEKDQDPSVQQIARFYSKVQR